MRKMISTMFIFCLIAVFSMGLAGCTVVVQKGRTRDIQEISNLKKELGSLERAKLELERQLKGEIDDREVSIDMLEKGLVITFVSEVLFGSGRAKNPKSKIAKRNAPPGRRVGLIRPRRTGRKKR